MVLLELEEEDSDSLSFSFGEAEEANWNPRVRSKLELSLERSLRARLEACFTFSRGAGESKPAQFAKSKVPTDKNA